MHYRWQYYTLNGSASNSDFVHTILANLQFHFKDYMIMNIEENPETNGLQAHTFCSCQYACVFEILLYDAVQLRVFGRNPLPSFSGWQPTVKVPTKTWYLSTKVGCIVSHKAVIFITRAILNAGFQFVGTKFTEFCPKCEILSFLQLRYSYSTLLIGSCVKYGSTSLSFSIYQC